MKRLSTRALCYSLAGALAVAGIALVSLPAPARSIPSFAEPQNTQDIAPAPGADRHARLKDLFDLSALPEPIAPPPAEAEALPPDPAAALKLYHYLGGASAGERNAALFQSDGAVATLKLGETLAGFTLISFNAEAASFLKGETEASLPLIHE